MKAMIIADDDAVIERVSSVVKAVGYDTIVYRWLLKALDNIEEIAPHLIVVSAKEYPRHWKTLVQFATSDFGGYLPQIILYTGGVLSDEDLRKAEALHIRGSFPSVSVEGLDTLREILASADDIYSGESEPAAVSAPAPEPLGTAPEAEDLEVPTVDALLEEADETEPVPADGPGRTRVTFSTIPCTLVFTDPVTGALVTGISRNYDGTTVEFEPDFTVPPLAEGMEIPSVSLKSGETITAFKASVVSAGSPLRLKLA